MTSKRKSPVSVSSLSETPGLGFSKPELFSTTPIGRPWRDLAEWKEWCAERAAIIEYDGNVSRKEAERAARTLAGKAP
jgi:hypothetical protein